MESKVNGNKRQLLGKRIRELRKRNGINQERLAELVGVDPTTISNIENGKNYPSLTNLESIIDVLGSTFSDVFDFEHKNDAKTLMEKIMERLELNPEKIEDVYKIVMAMTK